MHREGLPPVRGCNLQGTAGGPSHQGGNGRSHHQTPSAPSPLVSYLQLRTQTKHIARSLKPLGQDKQQPVEGLEPLNTVAGGTHEQGCTGGFFNSSTHLRALPLSKSAHKSAVTHKGTRVVMLHGGRFLPRVRSVSDSALSVSSLGTQLQRLSACEQRVAQSRFVKDFLYDPPHRLNFGYYMQGQTLPLSSVVGLSYKERESFHLATARNTDLYYGKGIRLTRQPMRSQRVDHFDSRTDAQLSEYEEDMLSDTDEPSDTFITQK